MRKLLLLILGVVYMHQGIAQEPTMKKLEISHLAGHVYVFTTYRTLGSEPFPSNGLYVVTDGGIALMDTPWDTTQFQPLMDTLEAMHHQPVVLCIATHYHDDRTAGLEFLAGKGVRTYSSTRTQALCRKNNEKQSQFTFENDTTFLIGEYAIQTYYPGEGHTRDNIVIWLEADKVLYGGCFIKSTETNRLGNLADANVAAWEFALERLSKKFPKANHIVPGHFGWSKNSLAHTKELLRRYLRGGDPKIVSPMKDPK